MKKQAVVRDEPWQSFYGPNLGYVMELYEQYLQDENAVEPEMREFFSTWTPESKKETARREVIQNQSVGNVHIDKLLAAIKLIDRLRVYGHLAAEIYQLKNRKRETKLIDPEHYGLTEADLENLDAALIWPNAPSHITNGLEVYNHLKHVYTKSIAVEFHHVENLDEKQWLTEKFENELFSTSISPEKKISMLTRLIEVEEFEKFLHRTFVGQKRFSIEGLDAMIPILDEIISLSVQSGAKTINIGMAHRGRLNVLAHVLEKPYEMIFSEFQHAPNKELVPSEGSIGINYGWTGDVKYHLGLDRQIKDDNTVQARITLANNPSHLEFVSPVVEGFTRAAQDDRTNPGYPSHNPATALPILIHVDAAFPGQGIVAETLNLSSLFGYKTGGAIHIIANNTIGFTTESKDSRSTKYASDLAKGYEIPIIRVNADDPEACMIAVKLACEYRETFKKDFLIDLVGYRRFGHNEMDEPLATNPLLYSIIPAHPTVKTIYSKQLVAEGVITEKQVNTIEQSVQEKLRSAYEKVPKERHDSNVELDPPETVEKGLPKMNTSVPLNMLKEVNDGLLNWPKDFHVFNKLEKILKRRSDAFTKKDLVDWSLAEALAFGTIISDGVPIRLTGQDSERGTFAHRHIVLHDHETGEIFSPLHTLQTAKASFAVHNSPLSEASVVGFEYGYNVFAPETLVLWEAQFGDFANSAQVMFDQFVAAGRAKWGQKSGLVILLPHGYEGQGPEHSSGRVERFLQLAAENNWTVANLTSAAQYFHILRRQAAILQKDEVRPLVLMSPKSLLRNPNVASSASELTEGEFKAVIEQPKLGGTPEKVERIVLCSGKIAINLAENIQSFEEMDWLHILRIEEIYPFPFETLTNIIKRYPNLTELVWIQEEPKNMGAWNFVEPRIHSIAKEGVSVKYIGRRRRSSPAEGDPNVHKAEQARIITEALTRNIEGGL